MSSGRMPGGRKSSSSDRGFDRGYETDGGIKTSRRPPGDASRRRTRDSSAIHNRTFNGGSFPATMRRSYRPMRDNELNSISLDQRDKVKNPVQKFVDGLKNAVKSISQSSPALNRRNSISNPSRSDSSTNTLRDVRGSSTYTDLSTATKYDNQWTSDSMIGFSVKGKFPGAVGIRNHGNTCFMNAVLQCLSNTEQFVEYLVTEQFREDLYRSGRKYPLTKQLVVLLQSIWTCQYRSEISLRLKEIIGSMAAQYADASQNDAQEFLLFLLDKIHEDLLIRSKDHRKTEEIMNGEKRRNGMHPGEDFIETNDIVNDLFEAKFRSTLTCSKCCKQSNTYDPFLSVSLPIQESLPVYVTIVRLNGVQRQCKFGFMMSSGDTILQLKALLTLKTGVDNKRILITQIYRGSFQRTFHNSEAIVDLMPFNYVYAIEMLPVGSSSAGSPTEDHPTSELINIVALNVVRKSKKCERFGSPFVVSVERDFSTWDLTNSILQKMQFMLNPMYTGLTNESLFRMRVVSNETIEEDYLNPNDEMPLYAVIVDDALSIYADDGFGPSHVKLVLEWCEENYKSTIVNHHQETSEDPSVKMLKNSRHSDKIDLHNCFSIFTQQEQLGAEDMWFCDNCQKRQPGTIKTLSLCSLPDVMVVHVKRLKQTGDTRTKVETLINFPINGLDMSCYIDQSQVSDPENSEFFYDLFAVCNHIGNLQSGHYTAFCKNPLNQRWYRFDDEKVLDILPQNVVTKAAYMLFYKRRVASSRSRVSLHQWVGDQLSVACSTPINRSHDSVLNDRSRDELTNSGDSLIDNGKALNSSTSGNYNTKVNGNTAVNGNAVVGAVNGNTAVNGSAAVNGLTRSKKDDERQSCVSSKSATQMSKLLPPQDAHPEPDASSTPVMERANLVPSMQTTNFDVLQSQNKSRQFESQTKPKQDSQTFSSKKVQQAAPSIQKFDKPPYRIRSRDSQVSSRDVQVVSPDSGACPESSTESGNEEVFRQSYKTMPRNYFSRSTPRASASKLEFKRPPDAEINPPPTAKDSRWVPEKNLKYQTANNRVVQESSV